MPKSYELEALYKIINPPPKLENLIENLQINLDDVNKHGADYCWIDIIDVEAILEFLNQLNTIRENEEERT